MYDWARVSLSKPHIDRKDVRKSYKYNVNTWLQLNIHRP